MILSHGTWSIFRRGNRWVGRHVDPGTGGTTELLAYDAQKIEATIELIEKAQRNDQAIENGRDTGDGNA